MSSRGLMGPPPRNLYQLDTVPVVASADFMYISDTSDINKLCKVSLSTLSTFFGGGSSGTVTSVATSSSASGFGLSGGPITTTGIVTFSITSAANARTTLGLGTAATTASTDYAPIAHVGSGGAQHADATTSVAGFMSAADKTKLDGITASLGLNGYYGDGSDGSATISSPTTTALTYRHLYDDLTLTSTLAVLSRPVFVYDVLDLTGAIASSINSNGAAAAGSVIGAAFALSNRMTPSAAQPVAGGTSSTTNGNAAAVSGASDYCLIANSAFGNSGRGGAGGASSPRTGGAARTTGNNTTFYPLCTPPVDPSISYPWGRVGASALTTLAQTWAMLSPAPGAGGGGAGSGTLAGTAGGAAGQCGGCTFVYARRIRVGASTAAGCISALGGNGGTSTNATNANTAAGGGGGGGHGGLIIVVCDEVFSTDGTTSVANALDASGGAGGTSGTPNGTATDGEGGDGGRGGRIVLWNRGAGTMYFVQGSTGGAPSGRTGGASGTCVMSLVVE